ncbi:MAG TPA: hypothetical protein PLE82_07520 [Saccharofermentans sp.]|nr:hypothetical protein [Saccharofermentans sp.]
MYNLKFIGDEQSSPPTIRAVPESEGDLRADRCRASYSPPEHRSAPERRSDGIAASTAAGQCSFHFSERSTCAWQVG